MKNLFSIESQMLLPFRSSIAPFTVSAKIPPEHWETTYTLLYDDKQRDIVGGLPPINVNLCTLIEIETCLPFNGSREDAKRYVGENRLKIMERMIRKLNHFLLCLKRVAPQAFTTGVLRNVGDIGLVFSDLSFERLEIINRINSTYVGGVATITLSEMQDSLSEPVPKGKSTSRKLWVRFFYCFEDIHIKVAL